MSNKNNPWVILGDADDVYGPFHDKKAAEAAVDRLAANNLSDDVDPAGFYVVTQTMRAPRGVVVKEVDPFDNPQPMPKVADTALKVATARWLNAKTDALLKGEGELQKSLERVAALVNRAERLVGDALRVQPTTTEVRR